MRYLTHDCNLARLGANTLAIDPSAEMFISIAMRHTAIQRRQRQRYRSGMRRLRCSSRSQSGSISYVRWRLSNTSMTRRGWRTSFPLDGCAVATCHLPLSYLTIVAAEKVFRLVEPGTHTFSKFVNPEELINFFTKPFEPGAHPWISWIYALLVMELRGSGGERNTSTPPLQPFPSFSYFPVLFSYLHYNRSKSDSGARRPDARYIRTRKQLSTPPCLENAS